MRRQNKFKADDIIKIIILISKNTGIDSTGYTDGKVLSYKGVRQGPLCVFKLCTCEGISVVLVKKAVKS